MDSDIPGNAPEGLYEMTSEEEKKKSGVFLPAWLCVVILVVGVAALALALLVSAHVMQLNRSMATATPGDSATSAVPVTEPAPAAEPAVEEETPPPAETDETPVATPVEEELVVPAEPKPAEAKPVQYDVVWGDTLWDLADAYYRDPWLYTRIAKHNRIKNPNLIITGSRIEIPPK